MLSDKKLGQDKETRKEKSNPASAASKARSAKKHKRADLELGDMVFLKSNGGKSTARDLLLVTAVNDSKLTIQKVLDSSPHYEAALKINSQKLRIQDKFLYAPPATSGGDRQPVEKTDRAAGRTSPAIPIPTPIYFFTIKRPARTGSEPGSSQPRVKTSLLLMFPLLGG